MKKLQMILPVLLIVDFNRNYRYVQKRQETANLPLIGGLATDLDQWQVLVLDWAWVWRHISIQTLICFMKSIKKFIDENWKEASSL